MRELWKRTALSFFISCVCGLLVNLIIDVVLAKTGPLRPYSMTPEFVSMFATPVIAAYVNILFYGLIGATFAAMTFIFDCERIGFVIQNAVYFIATGAVWAPITIYFWQLYKYPNAMISTALGYLMTYVIVTVVVYRDIKRNVDMINEHIG